jgi:glycosyltransferase involved in cell wall biosynthesis
MRILAVIVNLVPYHVARWGAVAAAGHQLTVLQRRAGDPFAVLGADAAEAPFAVYTLAAPSAAGTSWLRQLQTWIDRADPQVVVVSGYSFPESLAAMLAAAERRLPVVVCSESNRHDAPRRPWSEAVKRRVLRRAQAALVGGEPQASYLQELGISAQAIFRGYNAVDNRHFGAASSLRRQAAVAREQRGLPPRYLLAVSRFTAKKNLVTLIEGFGLWRGQALQDHRQLALLILGDGPLRPQLEARIAQLDLKQHVLLPGPCAYADLPGRYGLAEGFIHASTVEQWGLVVNEAMAAGLPVLVSSTCGCAPELVHPGVNGLRFDPHSPAAIATAIDWLTRQAPEAQQRLGQASRKHVSAYGPEAFALGLEAAVDHALHQPVSSLSRLDRALLQRLIARAASQP